LLRLQSINQPLSARKSHVDAVHFTAAMVLTFLHCTVVSQSRTTPQYLGSSTYLIHSQPPRRNSSPCQLFVFFDTVAVPLSCLVYQPPQSSFLMIRHATAPFHFCCEPTRAIEFKYLLVPLRTSTPHLRIHLTLARAVSAAKLRGLQHFEAIEG
jgi:hypothetical protein